MTTTIQEKRMEKLAEQLEEQASKRGGLPGLSDLREVEGYLSELGRVLDEYEMDVSRVAYAYGEEIPIPFLVELENVAALALVVAAARELWADDIAPKLESIERNLTTVEAVRRGRGTAGDA